jgi:DNA-binding MarR family transcriptional regulator
VVAPRFPEQPDFIGRFLRDLWATYTAEVTARLQIGHDGITNAQTRVMTLIDREGTRPSELARRAGMTRQSMNEALAGLERSGLVTITADPTHARAKVATLTAAGAAGLRDGLRAALAVHDRWAALLGERKMAQLLKLLGELRALVGDGGAHR